MKALFFLFCFILVMVSFGIAQDDFIFHYDFNQETAGKPPSDPWQPTAAGEVVVEKFPDEINKSVRITDPDGGGGMALILDSPIKDKIISLEFKWLLKESSGSEAEVFYVLNQKCADNWSGVCIAMTTGPGAVLQYHDKVWGNSKKIVFDAWHNFKYVMDLKRLKYHLYYDEKEIVKNAEFRKYDGVKGIDKFNVANVGNGGTTFTMYFDDIVLYEGIDRPRPVKPMSMLTTRWSLIKTMN